MKKLQERTIEQQRKAEEFMAQKPLQHECFAVQERRVIDKKVIELLDKESLKEKLSIKDGDEVEVLFYKPKKSN